MKRRRNRRKRRGIVIIVGLIICEILGSILLKKLDPVKAKKENKKMEEVLAKSEDTTDSTEKTLQFLRERPEEYPPEIIELFEKNPETKEFVLEYPSEKDKQHEKDIRGEMSDGKIPLFIQWDKRWGYDSYGNGMIAIDGCGPTCLSMVLTGLLGTESYNPKKVADFSAENGYITEEAGTKWALMTEGANQLGLYVDEIPLDENCIRRELEWGRPIICSMRPGDFTDKGHFIVLTGIASDGRICVNDPNSKIRSEQTWDLSRLMSQMKNLWSYTAY